MTPEGKTKALITKWFKKHSIKYRNIVPSPYGNSTGVSDYVAILKNGTWLAIEAKAVGKKDNTTKHQQDFLNDINSCNGIGVVVSCQSDLDELEKGLVECQLI